MIVGAVISASLGTAFLVFRIGCAVGFRTGLDAGIRYEKLARLKRMAKR